MALGLIGSAQRSRNPPQRFSIWAPAFAGETDVDGGLELSSLAPNLTAINGEFVSCSAAPLPPLA
jgi:hypothetical protein